MDEQTRQKLIIKTIMKVCSIPYEQAVELQARIFETQNLERMRMFELKVETETLKENAFKFFNPRSKTTHRKRKPGNTRKFAI